VSINSGKVFGTVQKFSDKMAAKCRCGDLLKAPGAYLYQLSGVEVCSGCYFAAYGDSIDDHISAAARIRKG
jgi:hypothetical protein